MIFFSRYHAGKKLAQKLQQYARRDDVVILALPGGGVPVAFEVSQELKAPLDIFIVRKLGLPGYEQLSMGAIASGGIVVENERLVRRLRIPPSVINRVAHHEELELVTREQMYRRGRPACNLEGKIVIAVDDGLPIGTSMKTVAQALKQCKAEKVIVAAPVGARQTCNELKEIVDEVICFDTPDPFWSVGSWYENFKQTTDAEVECLLDSAARRILAA